MRSPLPAARLVRLLVGLVLYGVAEGFMVTAHVGVGPWSVLATGLARQTGVGIGWLTVLIGAVVLLLWIPLRQKPGVGTVLNVLIVGTVIEATVDLLPTPEHLLVRVPLFAAGMVLLAVASGLYLGAALGPGPRDGLMTGLHARTGRSLGLCRTVVEVSVLVLGWLFGGNVGVGTVVFAFGIGPLVGWVVPRLAVARRAPVAVPVAR
ncbi:membrane protein YczE [Kineococcus sp. SYSU DK001]|uniref:membrane protein YczE n=1 Tax=Kineococcus sp. SYSU DK001 TaxID=3383122 RepID=UPI003D7EA59A